MPRVSDTAEDSEDQYIYYTCIVTCEECDMDYDASFSERAMDPEQVTDPPEGDQTCPDCGHVQHEVCSGWFNYGDGA